MNKLFLSLFALISLISCGSDNSTSLIIDPATDDYKIKVACSVQNISNEWYFDGNTTINPNKRMFHNYANILSDVNIGILKKFIPNPPIADMFETCGCLKKYLLYENGNLLKIYLFYYDSEMYISKIIYKYVGNSGYSTRQDTFSFNRKGDKLERVTHSYLGRQLPYIDVTYNDKNIFKENYYYYTGSSDTLMFNIDTKYFYNNDNTQLQQIERINQISKFQYQNGKLVFVEDKWNSSSENEKRDSCYYQYQNDKLSSKVSNRFLSNYYYLNDKIVKFTYKDYSKNIYYEVPIYYEYR